MEKNYNDNAFFMTTVLIMVMVTSISAQRTVNVPTFNPSDPVYLNEVISSDTNADGSRVDINTVYVLEIVDGTLLSQRLKTGSHLP